MKVLDSSFIFACFQRHDPRHEKALQELAHPEPKFVPVEVLAETLGVAHRRFAFEFAQAILEGLQQTPHVHFATESRRAEAQRIFLGHGGTLSWVDAAVVAWCLELDTTALAFDPALTKAIPSRAKR